MMLGQSKRGPGVSSHPAAAERSGEGGSPHGPFHPDNQALEDMAWFIWRGFAALRVQLRSPRLNGPGCHRNRTCVRVGKAE